MKKFCKLYSRAFTLVELLVVMAVLMIIAGLFLPAIGAAIAKARQVRSSANLTNIYTAYTSRRKDMALVRNLCRLPSDGWAGLLLSYVNYDKGVFFSPGDDAAHWGGVSLVVSCPPNSGLAPLVEGRYVRDASGGHAIRVEVENGQPGSDADWEVLITYQASQRFHRFEISTINETITPVMVLSDNETNPGRSFRSDGAIYDSGGRQVIEILKRGAEEITLGEPLRDSRRYMIRQSSYGMNDMFDTDFIDVPMHNTILIMEFGGSRINATARINDEGDGDEEAVPWEAFLKRGYRRKSSVLFADGSVHPVDPDTLNPNVDDIWRELWNPYRRGHDDVRGAVDYGW